jgi:hypothetical protein
VIGLADRIRAALRRRRLGLGAVDGRALPGRPLLALPAPPGAEHGPVCPHCGRRHPPLRLAPTWSTPIDGTADLGRPRPLRDDAPNPIVPRNPWRF